MRTSSNHFPNKIIIFLIIIALQLPIFSEEIKQFSVGDIFPTLDLKDQFDQTREISPNTKKVIFIADMDASKTIHSILEKEDKNYLESKQIILISDIHKMPSIITSLFALPKMKKYSYTIHLIREEKIGDPFPRTKGSATLIKLDSRKIIEIKQSAIASEIQEFITNSSSSDRK
ncbi:MAG: hypothetical protein SH817_18040 [Leptospira sp.]|nr:hypothetical protein [Leptospira sp.]